MDKVRVAFRLLIAFVLGAVVGVFGTGYAISSGHKLGDFFVAGAPQMKALQRDLDEARSHRDSVTRRFEDVASTLGQIERRYEDLGRRLEAIEAGLRRSQARAFVPESAPGPAVTPQPPRADIIEAP